MENKKQAKSLTISMRVPIISLVFCSQLGTNHFAMKKMMNLTTDSTLTIVACLLITIIGLCADSGAMVQNQDEDRTREAFLFHRETVSNKGAKGKAPRRKGRNSTGEKTDPNVAKTGQQNNSASGSETAIKAVYTPGEKKIEWTSPPAAAYSIFRQNGDANWVAVDSSDVFQKGNILRFVVETAQDGYLYVFNTTNGQSPQMIYPHPRLNGGANRIMAHVPYEIPSRDNPEFSGFELADAGVSEEIWMVVSKSPLSSIPIDSVLVDLCNEQQSECPWQPVAAIWNPLTALQKLTVTVDNRPAETASLSGTLEKAITRHIRLKSRAKGTEPAVIFRRQSGTDQPLALRISLMVR
jgi:hypothetical protein